MGYFYYKNVLQDFFRNVGGYKKNLKNVSEICLYSFLLRFYESDKHFREGEGFKPPKTLHTAFLRYNKLAFRHAKKIGPEKFKEFCL